MKTLEQRFWEKVDKRGDDECWNWKAWTRQATDRFLGYGSLNVNGKMLYAHRMSWEFTNGRIPKGLRVLHKCDNSLCVNPKHLFAGTQKDNMQDASVKGRNVKKLNNSKVIEILKLISEGKLKLKDIAMMYGVSATQVYCIKIGKRKPQVAGAEQTFIECSAVRP